jgi:hypothetical protein
MMSAEELTQRIATPTMRAQLFISSNLVTVRQTGLSDTTRGTTWRVESAHIGSTLSHQTVMANIEV